MTQHIEIAGGPAFELTLVPVPGGCHWLATVPGQVVLSGEAPRGPEARRVATATLAAWAELAIQGEIQLS
jgi:hypothetical protein